MQSIHRATHSIAHRVLALWMALAVSAGLLAGCGVLPQPQDVLGVNTVTPTATLDPSGYQAVAPRACPVGDWHTLQAERRQGQVTTWLQGNLMAWQPGTETLAYLAPDERSSWFTGGLMLASGPDFREPRPLAPTTLVNGDLTWSPSGEWLAFLAFRPNESLHTVMAVRADGAGLVDLFPTDLARTDQRTSQKAIIGWRDDQTVQVISSCGEECRIAFDLDVTTPPGPILTPTPLSHYRALQDNLQIDRLARAITPEAFPRIVSTPEVSKPHWSPDEDQVAYLDRRGVLWILSVAEKTNYPLEIGLRDVYETQWSTSGDYLAIRAEDRVFVYQVPCREPVP
jgi:hypothetical protein